MRMGGEACERNGGWEERHVREMEDGRRGM